MLSLFKTVKLPPPTDKMTKRHLPNFTTSLQSEIISGAYEPRFQLTALGTSTGFLYIVNSAHQVFQSPKSVDYPLLRIISLPNSSSFFSICSRSMFENHPSNANIPNNYNLTMLNSIKRSKVKNICTHWIITPEKILSRTVELNFDVLDIAISPIHPEFALMLTKEGSLYGFSIESLNFTNLYINIFENKPVKAICYSSGYKFIIAHETLDVLDVQNLELTASTNTKAQMVDSIDQWTSLIDDKGVPHLMMFFASVSSIDVPKNGKAIFTGMTDGSDWMSIIRTPDGDILYENRKEKVKFQHEFLIPGTLIKYEKPFARSSAEEIALCTNDGKFIYLDLKVRNHFIHHVPKVEFTLADGDSLYVFSLRETPQTEQSQDKKKRKKKDDSSDKSDSEEAEHEPEPIVQYRVNRYEKGNYYGHFSLSSLGIPSRPLAINKGKLLFIENNKDLCIYDTLNKKKEVLHSFNSFSHYRPLLNDGFILIDNDGTIMKCEKTEDSYSIEQMEETWPGPDIIDWRPYRDSIVTLEKDGHLKFGEIKKKICKNEEEQVFVFEVVNEKGKTPKEGEMQFIIVVTNKRMLVIDFNEEESTLIKARKVNETIIDATYTKWGTIIIQTDNSAQMLPLPDLSCDPIDKINISKKGVISLISQQGFIVFEPNAVSIFLKDLKPPLIFDSTIPIIEPPHVNPVLKWFGKKDDTLKDADDAFQYRRNHKVASNLAQTNELMQEILVKAQERGELLNEMEIKSEQVLSSAQKFHELCRSLRNSFW